MLRSKSMAFIPLHDHFGSPFIAVRYPPRNGPDVSDPCKKEHDYPKIVTLRIKNLLL